MRVLVRINKSTRGLEVGGSVWNGDLPTGAGKTFVAELAILETAADTVVT